ncbi:F-box/kelch-repeat protein [Trifolium pratense]|uniref:F-box/kelch-repeat protein n=1 Tax=Trifolium pratense TaxID=57577 RepID=A0A2K3PP12_TRIPR|nr:F-box/kelch-repeat protein [Trifolium pratense]
MNQPLYLPNELIIQILLRLPVKSLIRFKRVCKSWFSIISDTHFANSHFELTAATQTHRTLLLATLTPHETIELSVDDDDSVYALLNPPNFLPSKPNSCIGIKGSCRGFILFYCFSSRYLYLWNPSTGLHKQIPLSFNSDIFEENFYGFGYDQSTDDYLVVSGTSSSLWEFFSFRANKWKQIDDDGNNIHYWNATGDCRQGGSLFNGAIHWLAYCPDLENHVIVAFDLMKRKLFYMNFPDEFEHQLNHCGLWVFREFLSIWTWNYDNDVEIWVMKEYKVHSSWTKTHVLPIDAIPTKDFYPLTSTKSGDIVGIDYHTGLLKYNDEGQLLGHSSYCNNQYGLQVAMYTESLLSLPGDNVQA